jgi:4-hydroxyphenylacetate 3-monooxygenase
MYERMFGGNPVRQSQTLYQNYDKEPFKRKVRQFLENEDWP